MFYKSTLSAAFNFYLVCTSKWKQISIPENIDKSQIKYNKVFYFKNRIWIVWV